MGLFHANYLSALLLSLMIGLGLSIFTYNYVWLVRRYFRTKSYGIFLLTCVLIYGLLALSLHFTNVIVRVYQVRSYGTSVRPDGTIYLTWLLMWMASVALALRRVFISDHE